MNVKHNINFFKKSDTLKFVGLGLMIVGFAMLWFGWGWTAYILCTIGMPAGLVMFFIGSAGRSSEADIDSCIKHATQDLEAKLEEDRHYARRILKHLPPVTVEGYEYEEGLMYKKGKNGSLRSSKYTKSMIYILSDRLYISRADVDLIGDSSQRSIVEIKYGDITDISIIREQKSFVFNKNTFKAKICEVVVRSGEQTVYRSPLHDDIQTEALVDKINGAIGEYRKASAADT